MPANEISLHGWDTANAVSFDVVNRAIRTLGSTPAGFDAQVGIPTSDGRIVGEWDPWRLVLGGSGPLLHMECPVKSGTGTREDGSQEDLAGVVLRIQLRLAQVPQPPAPVTASDGGYGVGAGERLALKANLEGTDDDPAVVVVGFEPEALEQDFQIAFDDWFNANLQEFHHVFHVVELNQRAAKGDFLWLKPTAVGYAAADGATLARSVFGVLSMTEERSAATLGHEVEPALLADLPAGANSVFAIAGERFVEKVLLYGSLALLQGSTEADFDLVEDGLGITNNKELAWRKQKLADDSEVTPRMPANGFHLRVRGNVLEMEFKGLTFDSPSWHFPGQQVVSMDFTQKAWLQLLDKGNGEHVLFVTNEDPEDPDAKDIPTLDNLSVSIQLDEAARTFENAMLGFSIALSIVAIGGGLFAGGKWAVGAAMARRASRAAQAVAEVGEGAVAMNQAELAAAAEAGVAEDVANGTNQYTAPPPPPANEYESMSAAIDGTNQGAAQEYGELVAVPAGEGVLATPSKLATWMNRFAIGAGVSAAIAGATSIPTWAVFGAAQGQKVAAGDLGDAEAITGFLDDALGASTWPATAGWTLKHVRLAKSLLLYGEL